MKSQKIKWNGFTTRSMWCAFRDTAFLIVLFWIVGAVMTLIKKNRIIPITTRGIIVTGIIFSVVFAVNSIACAFGMSTLTDHIGGPRRGYGSNVPATMVITAVVGLISFVVLLLMGFVTK